MRLEYRIRQFWHALHSTPTEADLDSARALLSPGLMELFLRMETSEQAHSLRVFQDLLNSDLSQPDLLVAALLHDVGKSLYPLRLWERVWIVIARILFPKKVKSWGQGAPRGWRRAFVIAEQHPTWSAELAQHAGASELAVELVRRHQDPLYEPPNNQAEFLLHQLQKYDNRE